GEYMAVFAGVGPFHGGVDAIRAMDNPKLIGFGDLRKRRGRGTGRPAAGAAPPQSRGRRAPPTSRELRPAHLGTGVRAQCRVAGIYASDPTIFRYSSSVKARRVSVRTKPIEALPRASLATVASSGASEMAMASYWPVTR